MFNIIPLILILVSLAIISIILIKKFPLLANLDVENIPAEKEAKFKEQIISNRINRNLLRWKTRLLKVFRPLGESLGKGFNALWLKLHAIREKYRQEAARAGEDLNLRIAKLMEEAEGLVKREELPEAEKKLIEVIGLDNRNIVAFKLLGDVYFGGKNYDNARQTYEFVLKLKEDDEEAYDDLAKVAREEGKLEEARDDYLKSIKINSHHSETYFDLTLVYEAMEDFEAALEAIKNALEIEPNNPRYLDTMLRISIIKKDKVSALNAYEKLKEVNPENQKLDELKGQIDEL